MSNQPLIPLVPVYYCLHATTGTISPQYLQLYNGFQSPTHLLFQYLSMLNPNDQQEIRPKTTRHNNLDFVKLPIIHFSNNMRTIPTIAHIYTNGLNNQLTHQQFDHWSMETILKMKHNKMTNGIPSNITKFHDEYTYPICMLTKTTKMKRNKTIPFWFEYEKGELLCM